MRMVTPHAAGCLILWQFGILPDFHTYINCSINLLWQVKAPPLPAPLMGPLVMSACNKYSKVSSFLSFDHPCFLKILTNAGMFPAALHTNLWGLRWMVHCLNGKKKCWALALCNSELKSTSTIFMRDSNAPITIKHPSSPLRCDTLDYKILSAVIWSLGVVIKHAVVALLSC